MEKSSPHPTVGLYLGVFVALLLLLGVTVWVAELDFGRWNFPIAAGIATIKAVLIMLFFMQVRYSTPLTRLVAVAAILWLAILFGITMSDYMTRPTGQMQWQQPDDTQFGPR